MSNDGLFHSKLFAPSQANSLLSKMGTRSQFSAKDKAMIDIELKKFISHTARHKNEVDVQTRDVSKHTWLSNIKRYLHLYHYSNAEAITSMISKDELWLTHARFQNDQSEIAYSTSLITTLAKNLQVFQTQDSKHPNQLEDPEWHVSDEKAKYTPFLFSLTEEQDCLPLWVYYSSGDGYNIGIETETFYNALNSINEYFLETHQIECLVKAGRVMYDLPEQLDIIYNALILQKKYSSDNNMQRAREIEEQLLWLRYFIKDPCFKDEHEIRIVVLIPTNSLGKVILHRNKSGSIVPYIKIAFREMDQKLPINSIMIGPRNKSDLSSSGIRSLLKWNGHPTENIKINASKVPLRY